MEIEILYEDVDLLVVNKPAGIVVNRATTVQGETVQDWVERRSNQQSATRLPARQVSNQTEDDFVKRSGIVHRLDKETSGCLIIAKNPEIFYKLQSAFKNHEVKKEYVALAHGKLEPKTGEINAPVGRLPWNREQFGVFAGGKEAHTRYEVEQYYSSVISRSKVTKSGKAGSGSARQSQTPGIFSLVRLFPTTGRTHQLRVHLKYLGFPIVGDYLYAGRKQQRADRLWCPRVFLHATKISFPHPKNGQLLDVLAPMPQELISVLRALQY